MKTSVSASMAQHLAQEVTTTAYLWKVIRQDSAIFTFTSHDAPIVFDGHTYEASAGFMPSAVQTTSGLAVDDLELEGLLSSESITQQDLVAGLWDGAEVWLYQVNYLDLTAGAVICRRGWIGEVRSGKTSFVAELRGVAQRLSQQIGQFYSPSCRADFGDGRCKLNLASFTVTGAVTGVTNRHVFTDSSRTEAAGFFDLGLIAFTSGANSGFSQEVKTFSSGVITSELSFPNAITIGDAYVLQQGCDKTFATCKDRYNNIVNFRGEPYVPVIDALIRGPQ